MPTAIVIGGGLAGLAAAAALGDAGFQVDLYEARGFLGGRATSYALRAMPARAKSSTIASTSCCAAASTCWISTGAWAWRTGSDSTSSSTSSSRVAGLRHCGAGRIACAAALHGELSGNCTSSALRDKLAIARALLAIRREHGRRGDLDRITHAGLAAGKTPDRPRHRALLESGAGQRDQRRSGSHGRDRTAFRCSGWDSWRAPNSYEMGVPAVPLGELYGSDAWKRDRQRAAASASAGGSGHGRERIDSRRAWCRARSARADYYISRASVRADAGAVPATRPALDRFEHSPITGIHLWFDRSVTHLPHATLLDRTMQWMFNKSGGRYLQLVVSASRSLVDMSRNDVIALAVRELGGVSAARSRSETGKGARGEGSARDVFAAARHGSAAARERDENSQSFSGRRLDAFRLAGHDGGRGAQRISGG